MSASKPKRALAALGVLAIAVPAAAFAGCGSDDAQDQVNEAIENAQDEIDQATEDAGERAEELQQEIEDQVDEAREEINEATDDDTSSTTTEDSGGYSYP